MIIREIPRGFVPWAVAPYPAEAGGRFRNRVRATDRRMDPRPVLGWAKRRTQQVAIGRTSGSGSTRLWSNRHPIHQWMGHPYRELLVAPPRLLPSDEPGLAVRGDRDRSNIGRGAGSHKGSVCGAREPIPRFLPCQGATSRAERLTG